MHVRHCYILSAMTGEKNADLIFLFWAERDEVGAALWSQDCIVVIMEDPAPG